MNNIEQLTTEIASLNTAIAALAALPDEQARLQQQRDAKQRQIDALTQQSGGVNMGSGNTITNAGGVFGGDNVGTKHVYYGLDYSPDRATLLQEYLRSLSGTCNTLSLADADSSDPNSAAVQLAAVYTGLKTARIIEGEEEPEAIQLSLFPTRQQRALEALAQHPRLVLLGDPGGGKSTFVNFITLCLAQIQLGAPDWDERLGDDWPHSALLPVRVVLREFAAWLAERPRMPQRGDVALLWLWLAEQHGKELTVFMRQQIAAGRVLLLLDGLDEVPADQQQQPLTLVRQTIASLGGAAGASRMLVTCRVLDYQYFVRRLHGWPSEQLIQFSDDLRAQFVTRWFDVLAALDRPLNGEADVLREQLKTAIRERQELRRLAGNPLLLTMMTLLHAYEGRLPDERVRLYEKCVEFLLHRWRAGRGQTSLREELDLPHWSDADMGALLDRLGYAAHARSVSGDSETGADLPRSVLIETARAFFAPFGTDHDFARAQAFCRYLSHNSNGVLQQYGPETYRFPHRTFQEYLAARRLTSDDWPEEDVDIVDRMLARAAEGSQWREAVLLAVSRMVLDLKQARPPADVAEALLNRANDATDTLYADDVLLAGDILIEVGRERIARLGRRHAALWQRATEALLDLIQSRTDTGAMQHAVADRVRAGFLLGNLGDPRFPVTPDEWRAEWNKTQRGDTGGYFCRVEAGTYVIGSDDDDPDAKDDEKPQHNVIFDEPFWIGRFPITNDQWQAWVEAGGEPSKHADKSDFNHFNQPVVGVDWSMCHRFCEWVSEHLDTDVRLPTEQEWEAAARGGDARRYPWGDEWQDDHAAIEEDEAARIARSSLPVGCYPAGATPCGALDMAGNIWDWTASTWQSYPNAEESFVDEGTGVLRGGAYNTDSTLVRCGARLRGYPFIRVINNGFRIVVTSYAHSSTAQSD